MGDLRKTDYGFEHQEAGPGQPEQWRTYSVDQCGKLLPGCLHSDDVTSTVEPETGRLVLALGGNVISMAVETAQKILGAFVQHVNDGKQIDGQLQIEELDEQLAQRKARRLLDMESEVATRRSELAAEMAVLAEQVEALKPEPEPEPEASPPAGP